MPDHTFYTEEFSRALLDPELRPALFEGDTARVDAGLDVYRNNVMHSLITAISEIYPVVRALVGEEFFAGLARTHIRSSPPASAVLAEYGYDFPEFLEHFEPAQAAPYLADVARLERAWLDAWHAPDAPPLAAETLAAVPPEQYACVVFTCHPSLRCIASPFPVLTIWEAHQQDGEMPQIDLSQGPEECLVLRPAMDVLVHRTPPGTTHFLGLLGTGRTLGEALEETLPIVPEFDLGGAMQLLIGAGAFTDFGVLTKAGRQHNECD